MTVAGIFALLSCPGQCKLKQLLSFYVIFKGFTEASCRTSEGYWGKPLSFSDSMFLCSLVTSNPINRYTLKSEIQIWVQFLQVVVNLTTENNNALLKCRSSCHRKLLAITTAILPCYSIVCVFMPDLPMTFLKPKHLAKLLPSSEAMLSRSVTLDSKHATTLFQIPGISFFLSSSPVSRLVASKLTASWVEVNQPRGWKET